MLRPVARINWLPAWRKVLAACRLSVRTFGLCFEYSVLSKSVTKIIGRIVAGYG